LKISTIRKIAHYWIVARIFTYSARYATENFPAARGSSPEIATHSRAAAPATRKIAKADLSRGLRLSENVTIIPKS